MVKLQVIFNFFFFFCIFLYDLNLLWLTSFNATIYLNEYNFMLLPSEALQGTVKSVPEEKALFLGVAPGQQGLGW